MKVVFPNLLLLLVTFSMSAQAGLTAFGDTWMPLTGFDTEGVAIHRVPYINHHAGSGIPNGFDVVDDAFVPPTIGTEVPKNANLASLAGFKITSEEARDIPLEMRVTIDTTGVIDGDVDGYESLEVFTATLECIRRLSRNLTVDFVLKSKPSGQEAFIKEFEKFQKHPRDQVFYLPNE